MLQIKKTRQIFSSRDVRINENNLPGFHNETKDTDGSFLYLELDKVREEPQDTNKLSELSSEVKSTETVSVQEIKNNRENEVEQEIKNLKECTV